MSFCFISPRRDKLTHDAAVSEIVTCWHGNRSAKMLPTATEHNDSGLAHLLLKQLCSSLALIFNEC